MPRKIDLWMFTELAILVDKYELLKSVEILLNCWLQNLKRTIPMTFNNDLFLWIFISWMPEIVMVVLVFFAGVVRNDEDLDWNRN